MLYSPINYTGNKSRIINEIVKLIPKDIVHFTDVFCGSGIVGLSVNAEETILNDIDNTILDLISFFKNNEPKKIINEVDKIIANYGLTNTYYEGKSKYIEYKHEGLSLYNKQAYENLKKSYNKSKNIFELFTLIIYGFNHYIRFNKNGEYNIPVGKVDFVKSLREKTNNYCNIIQNKNLILTNFDFRNKNMYFNLNAKDFYYFDPPYLITLAPYNTIWTEKEEIELLQLLDWLNEKHVKFALSNVIESNGKENKLLKQWMTKYNVHYLNRRYLNASYQKKNLSDAIEVVITNY